MRPSAYDYAFLARLLHYLGRSTQALDVFAEGLAAHPGNAVLHRHRGHRYLTERAFDAAMADLRAAAAAAAEIDDEIEFYQPQVEEDLANLILHRTDRLRTYPVPVTEATLARYRDVYKGTLRASIWYHLALIHYLRGDFDEAVAAYRTTLGHCADDDMVVATVDWLYLSLRRAGREEEAREVLRQVHDGMHLNERSYHQRLRLYRGATSPGDLLASARTVGNFATQAYGVGAWLLCEGRAPEAVEVFRTVVRDAPKAAFGRIGAEIELARLGDPAV